MQRVLSVKIDDETAELIQEIAREEGTGKSPVARKLLELGARQWRLEKAIQSVIAERTSVWRASQMAGVSLREFLDTLQERRIDWVRISPAELEEELKLIKGGRWWIPSTGTGVRGNVRIDQ